MALNLRQLALAAVATLPTDHPNPPDPAAPEVDVSSSKNRVTVEREVAPEYLPTPALVDALVQTVDGTVRALQQSTELKLRTTGDLGVGEDLDKAFTYYDENRKHNSNRNAVRWWLEARQKWEGLWAEAPSTSTFWVMPTELYDKNTTEMKGWFADTSRVLAVPEDCNPLDVTCQLTVAHELVHAMQDTAQRDALPPAALNRYFSWKLRPRTQGPRAPRVDVDAEVQATLFEVRILNLLLDGDLERGYAAKERFDHSELGRRLEIPHASLPNLKDTLLFAEAYYAGDPKYDGGNLPSKKFLEVVVAGTHGHKGFELYQWEATTGVYGAYIPF